MLCKSIDSELWEDGYSDKYIDLVALGMVSDMMDVSHGYMYNFINNGLNNIRNKGLDAIVMKQDFTIGEKADVGQSIYPTDVSFSIAPVINSVYRLGTMQDKINLQNSFLEVDDHTYIYKPTRGKNKGEEIEETLQEKVARECISLNGKRKRLSEKIVKELTIDDSHKIYFLKIPREYGEKSMGRLVANSISRNMMKPAIVFYENKEGKFKGSMSSGDVIENFQDKLNETGVFKFVSGHQGASGLELKEDMVEFEKTDIVLKNDDGTEHTIVGDNLSLMKGQKILNEYFSDFVFEKVPEIDFDIPFEYFQENGRDIIEEIENGKKYYGKGLEEPRIKISDIVVRADKISISKTGTTIKIKVSDDLEIIKFKSSKDEFNSILGWDNEVDFEINPNEAFVKLDILGKVGINRFRNNVTYQIIIDDFEVISNGSDLVDFVDDEWGEDDGEW